MRTNNKTLIEKLVHLDIIKAQPAMSQNSSINTIVFKDDKYGTNFEIQADSLLDEDLPLLIQTEQLETLKSIKSMIKFHTILTVIGICAVLVWFIVF